MTVTVGTAAGRECTVVSAYLGVANQPIREVLPETTGIEEWFHDTAERVWEAAITDSDLLRITCDDPGDARRLATSTRV